GPGLRAGLRDGGAEVRRAPDQEAPGGEDPPGEGEGGEGRVVMDRTAGEERSHGTDRRGAGDADGDDPSRQEGPVAVAGGPGGAEATQRRGPDRRPDPRERRPSARSVHLTAAFRSESVKESD